MASFVHHLTTIGLVLGSAYVGHIGYGGIIMFFFDWADIPWSELAFPTVVWALTHYAETRDRDVFVPFANPPGTDTLTR